MKIKKTTRALSLVLSALMLLSLISVPAFAVEGDLFAEDFSGENSMINNSTTGTEIVDGALKTPLTAANNDKRYFVPSVEYSSATADYLAYEADYVISSTASTDSFQFRFNTHYHDATSIGATSGSWLNIGQIQANGKIKYFNSDGDFATLGTHTITSGTSFNYRVVLDLAAGTYRAYVNGELDHSDVLFGQHNVGSTWYFERITNVRIARNSFIPANTYSKGADASAYVSIDNIRIYNYTETNFYTLTLNGVPQQVAANATVDVTSSGKTIASVTTTVGGVVTKSVNPYIQVNANTTVAVNYLTGNYYAYSDYELENPGDYGYYPVPTYTEYQAFKMSVNGGAVQGQIVYAPVGTTEATLATASPLYVPASNYNAYDWGCVSLTSFTYNAANTYTDAGTVRLLSVISNSQAPRRDIVTKANGNMAVYSVVAEGGNNYLKIPFEGVFKMAGGGATGRCYSGNTNQFLWFSNSAIAAGKQLVLEASIRYHKNGSDATAETAMVANVSSPAKTCWVYFYTISDGGNLNIHTASGMTKVMTMEQDRVYAIELRIDTVEGTYAMLIDGVVVSEVGALGYENQAVSTTNPQLINATIVQNTLGIKMVNGSNYKENSQSYIGIDNLALREGNATIPASSFGDLDFTDAAENSKVNVSQLASGGVVNGTDGHIHVPFYGSCLSNTELSGNADKSVYFNNIGIGAKGVLVIEADYKPHFVSTTNYAPTVEAQFQNWSAWNSETSAYVNLNYLSLWKINLQTGELLHGDSATSKSYASDTKLTLDEWNTVTTVFDLVNGTYDVYINGVLRLSAGAIKRGTVENATKISVNANSIILAKCNKNINAYNTTPETDDDNYIDIDNVKVLRCGDETVNYTLNGENKSAVAYSQIAVSADLLMNMTLNGAVVKGNKFLAKDGAAIVASYFDATAYENILTSVNGASIRVGADAATTGLRFATEIDMAKVAALKADPNVASVSVGTLITPYASEVTGNDWLVELGALTGHTVNYVDVAADLDNLFPATRAGLDAEKDYFAGSLVAIKTSHFATNFTGISYITITFVNGGAVTLYGTAVTRNVKAVATNALADTAFAEKLTPAQTAVLEAYAAN